jgi:hypothetical protein
LSLRDSHRYSNHETFNLPSPSTKRGSAASVPKESLPILLDGRGHYWSHSTCPTSPLQKQYGSSPDSSLGLVPKEGSSWGQQALSRKKTIKAPQGLQPVSVAFPIGRSFGCVWAKLGRLKEEPQGKQRVPRPSQHPSVLTRADTQTVPPCGAHTCWQEANSCSQEPQEGRDYSF